MNNSVIVIGCTQDRLKFVGAITGNLYLYLSLFYTQQFIFILPLPYRQFWICEQDVWVLVYVCVSVYINLTPPHKKWIYYTIVKCIDFTENV
jgi:hypothetical protein